MERPEAKGQCAHTDCVHASLQPGELLIADSRPKCIHNCVLCALADQLLGDARGALVQRRRCGRSRPNSSLAHPRGLRKYPHKYSYLPITSITMQPHSLHVD